MRNRAASRQAEAKWMRIRAAFVDDARADLEQALPEGGELGPGERHPSRHGIAQGEHQPVGFRGVQDEAELVGERCSGMRSGRRRAWPLCSLMRFSAWPRAQ